MYHENSTDDRRENHPTGRQKRRNLFPIFAFLAAAGTTVGIFSLILNLADAVGGAPTPTTTLPRPETRSTTREDLSADSFMGQSSTLSASVSTLAALPRSTLLGAHSAPVVSIVTPQTRRVPSDNELSDSELFADDAFNSALVMTGSHDNTVRIWATGTGSDTDLPEALVHNSYVNDLALVPNLLGAYAAPFRLVTGSGSGEIKLWELISDEDAFAENAFTGFKSSQIVTTIADNVGRILSVAANADGRLIASGSSNGTLKIWPVEEIINQESQTNLRGQVLNVTGPDLTALRFHPTNPNLLISGNQLGNLHVWDVSRMQITLSLTSNLSVEPNVKRETHPINSLSISADGRYLASASERAPIRIWDIETGELTQTLAGHRSPVTDVAFSPNGQLLASSSDQTIKTWNWTEGNESCTLSDQAGPVQSIEFASSGRTLISGSDDGKVSAWDLSRYSHEACIESSG